MAVGAAVVVVALAVPIPIVLLADSSSQKTKADPRVTSVDATTRGLLAVLDRPRTTSDALLQPAAGAGRGSLSDRTPAESYNLARRPLPALTREPVYIWPRLQSSRSRRKAPCE